MTAEREEKLKAANFPFNLDVAQLKTPKKHPYRIGTKAPKKQQSTLKASKKNLRNLDDKEEPNAVEPIETPTERTLRSGTKSMTIPTKRTRRSGPNTQKKLKAVEVENLAKDSEAVEPANYAEAVASNAEAVSPANSEAAEIANLEAAESANVAKDAEILESSKGAAANTAIDAELLFEPAKGAERVEPSKDDAANMVKDAEVLGPAKDAEVLEPAKGAEKVEPANAEAVEPAKVMNTAKDAEVSFEPAKGAKAIVPSKGAAANIVKDAIVLEPTKDAELKEPAKGAESVEPVNAEVAEPAKEAVSNILLHNDVKTKVELLTCSEAFVDMQPLLSRVKTLISAGKFGRLGESNVYQFNKEYTDINFGVWGNLIQGRSKTAKAKAVKEQKKHFFDFFKTSNLLVTEKIVWDEVQVTVLYSDPTNVNKQDPHTDYDVQPNNSPSDFAWTAHLPLAIDEGSYIYIWTSPGCGSCIHIKGGHCLLLRSDVVHSGGLPESLKDNKNYIRLHFYLPTKEQKPPPLGNMIYRAGSDGNYYSKTHWHNVQHTTSGITEAAVNAEVESATEPAVIGLKVEPLTANIKSNNQKGKRKREEGTKYKTRNEVKKGNYIQMDNTVSSVADDACIKEVITGIDAEPCVDDPNENTNYCFEFPVGLTPLQKLNEICRSPLCSNSHRHRFEIAHYVENGWMCKYPLTYIDFIKFRERNFTGCEVINGYIHLLQKEFSDGGKNHFFDNKFFDTVIDENITLLNGELSKIDRKKKK